MNNGIIIILGGAGFLSIHSSFCIPGGAGYLPYHETIPRKIFFTSEGVLEYFLKQRLSKNNWLVLNLRNQLLIESYACDLVSEMIIQKTCLLVTTRTSQNQVIIFPCCWYTFFCWSFLSDSPLTCDAQVACSAPTEHCLSCHDHSLYQHICPIS